jgi:hypothetical protein
MPKLHAVTIVESLWADVWAARNPDATDRSVVDDVVFTNVRGKEMTRRHVLVGVVVAMLLTSGVAAATEAEDKQAVQQVYAKYLQSVNSADVTLAEQVWSHTADIIVVMPLGRFQGWNSVRDDIYILKGAQIQRGSRRALILMQQASETIAANDKQFFRLRVSLGRCPAIRRREVQASMSPMSVVMINEHCEDPLKMTGVEDQQPIKALGTDGPHESFRNPVRLRRLNRRPHDPNAGTLKHLIEAPRELAIVVPNQQANRFRTFGEHPRYLTCLLRDPPVAGMGGTAGEVHASRGHFDEEQHVQPPQPDRVDGEEINGDHALRLRLKEVTPRRAWSCTRRTQVFVAENVPDCRGRHDDAQSFQFAHDALIAPSWILARYPQDQLANLEIDRPSPGAVTIRPTPGDQSTMPLEQRGRLDDEHRPDRTWQQPTGGGQEHSIGRRE